MQSKRFVRNYIKDYDLDGIISMYKSFSKDHVIFSRDENFIKHILNYPGITDERIFVCYIDTHIDGIAILSLGYKNDILIANILELCALDHLCTEMLLESIYNYSKINNIDAVYFRPFSGFKPQELGVKANLIKVESGALMIKPFRLHPLIETLVNIADKRGMKPLRITSALNNIIIELDPYKNPFQFTFLGNRSFKSNIILSMSESTFLEIIFGVKNIYKALACREIKINKILFLPYAIKLLHSLRCEAPNATLIDEM